MPPPNVELLYNIDILTVKELYRSARLTCLILKGDDTTEGSDCTGQTVLLEALGAHQPVITSDRAWIREYFTPGVDYVPVPIGDAQRVAECIRELWDNAARRTALGERGNQTARTLYQTKGMADVLTRIIESDRQKSP